MVFQESWFILRNFSVQFYEIFLKGSIPVDRTESKHLAGSLFATSDEGGAAFVVAYHGKEAQIVTPVYFALVGEGNTVFLSLGIRDLGEMEDSEVAGVERSAHEVAFSQWGSAIFFIENDMNVFILSDAGRSGEKLQTLQVIARCYKFLAERILRRNSNGVAFSENYP